VKRVFYYSGFRLTVFHWQGEKCISSYVFNPDEAGLEKFKTYLMASDNIPARILIDLIEEDFKQENIPHVGAADRKSIVTRLIERQHRNSKDYVHYNIIGREKIERKDDILLYSILSNPQILAPWLKVIAECNTSICGIWSLPLLSEKLFTQFKQKANNILLVSQQVPSNLRQTFIKKSKFQSSRSAVVNLEDATVGEHISIEVEQTIRFLSNQRHIGFDEKIEVHIMCREGDITEIKLHCEDSALRSFHFHNIIDIIELLGCDAHFENSSDGNDKITSPSQFKEYSNGLYSYVCSQQLIPVGHYGNRNLFTRFYEQLLSKSLYTASGLTLLVTIILSFYFLSVSSTFTQETMTLKSQTQGVIKEYEKKLAHLQSRLSQAQVMQSSVLLAHKIQTSKRISPQNFMADISRVLTRSGMNDTEITHIIWKQHQSDALPPTSHNLKPLHTDYASSTNINQHAIIGGYIKVSNSSLKASVDKVNSIVDAFKHHKLIRHVKINRMPVDVRSKSSIENESGVEQQDHSSQDKNKGQFEIELILQSQES